MALQKSIVLPSNVVIQDAYIVLDGVMWHKTAKPSVVLAIYQSAEAKAAGIPKIDNVTVELTNDLAAEIYGALKTMSEFSDAEDV